MNLKEAKEFVLKQHETLTKLEKQYHQEEADRMNEHKDCIDREALVSLVERMKKTEYVDGIFANGAGEYNIVTGYNEALENLLKEINK